MPVHEKHYVTEDTTDLVKDGVREGITAAAGGILAAAGDTPPNDLSVGEYNVEKVTATAADSVTAESVDVTWTDPTVTGFTKVDILVVDEDGVFVSRTEEDVDAETATIDCGATGDFTAYIRLVNPTTGRVGPFGTGDTATVA